MPVMVQDGNISGPPYDLYTHRGSHEASLLARAHYERGLSEVNKGEITWLLGAKKTCTLSQLLGKHPAKYTEVLSGGIESDNGVVIRSPNCGEDAGIQSSCGVITCFNTITPFPEIHPSASFAVI